MQENDSKHWIVIHIAHTAEHAERIIGLLNGEGFMVKLNRIEHANEANGSAYEVLALKSEALEARAYLVDNCL